MSAELTGVWARDCSCVTHDGPHWLHMQLLDREALSRAVSDAGEQATGAFAAWAYGEAARLEHELAAEMERHGIDVLPAAVVQHVRASRERWASQYRARRRARVEKRAREIAEEYEFAGTERRREIERESVALSAQMARTSEEGAGDAES